MTTDSHVDSIISDEAMATDEFPRPMTLNSSTPRDTVTTLLRDLAIQLHHARSNPDNGITQDGQPPNIVAAAIVAKALPLFTASRSQQRKAALSSKADRTRISTARSHMDAAYLALQGLKYEMDHLVREIEKCNDYDSIYEQLPLIDDEEFTAAQPGAVSQVHERMVARLQDEVEARQKAQVELKALLASKTKVIKETEVRKSSLEQLEKQLEEFVTSAKAIQTRFATM